MPWYPCCCGLPGPCPCTGDLPEELPLAISGIGDSFCDCSDVDGSYLLPPGGSHLPCGFSYQKFMDPPCKESDNNYPPPWYRWRLFITVTTVDYFYWDPSSNPGWYATFTLRREINHFNPDAEIWWGPQYTQTVRYIWENSTSADFDCEAERELEFYDKKGTELCSGWEDATVIVN